MARHLLVTNDYPPKTGGIQVYLHELWRRLEPDRAVVLTATSAPETEAFDAASEIVIERIPKQDTVLAHVAREAFHRVGDRAPPTRPGPARSGVAPRAARSATLRALRRRRARVGSDGARTYSHRRLVDSLRVASRRGRDLRRHVPRIRGAPHRRRVRAADHPGAAGRRHVALRAARATEPRRGSRSHWD